VADPREAVKVGEIVKVKVLEVDYQRERISLSIKALQQPPAEGRHATGNAGRPAPKGGNRPPAKPSPKPAATMEDLMKKFNRQGR
ncbi:MAG TPA: S1 RNA-binding domain-containing protein, partial [Gemmatimonadales bacterium]|nr:S1 RNA-binding domain-containing protein [Gemmatimonadales bacterium]